MSSIRRGAELRGAGLLALTIATAGCVSTGLGSPAASAVTDPERRRVEQGPAGVLVMAHGGSEDWNASVREAVAPIASELPTRIAFGMADPTTLQRAIDQLEEVGVRRIAVVRLFVSGESFLHRTEFLFGRRLDPPPEGPTLQGDTATLAPLGIESEIELDVQGLIDGSEVATIVRERADALSLDSASEVVLMIGHGSGQEDVNQRILQRMDVAADAVLADGFAEVRVETLREDWREQRELAERRIRAWVEDRGARGHRVLVIPFRLSGFGPYADVLKELEYEADGLGLLPHPAITEWIRRRANALLGGEILRDRGS